MTGLSTLPPDSRSNLMTAVDGCRINAEQYRELIVSRRTLVRTVALQDDLLGLRDTSTGETFLVDFDLVFSRQS